MNSFIGKFDKCVTDESGNLIVSFAVPYEKRFEAKQCIATIKTLKIKGKDKLKIDVEQYREKRSNQANNYFWQLCTKIAEKLNTTKEEIYRKYIKEQGIFKRIEINEDAEQTFIASWAKHGAGWIAERVDYSKAQGFVVIFAYYGSSVYNRKQMSRLIDSVVTDCKELDIETKTPAQIAEMVSLWESKR